MSDPVPVWFACGVAKAIHSGEAIDLALWKEFGDRIIQDPKLIIEDSE